MKYSVGQILYVIPSKQTSVYPMQIVEEVTKKSLTGDIETIYMVRGGPDTKDVIRLDEISGEIFDSADIVHKTLIERVTVQITRLVDSATKKAHEWFTDTPNRPVTLNVQDTHKKIDTVVDLGGGIMGTVKLPDIMR